MSLWPALALIALAAFLAGAIWLAGHRQGVTTTRKSAAEAEVAAARRIVDAEANAPSDRAALVGRLRDAKRKL